MTVYNYICIHFDIILRIVYIDRIGSRYCILCIILRGFLFYNLYTYIIRQNAINHHILPQLYLVFLSDI